MKQKREGIIIPGAYGAQRWGKEKESLQITVMEE